MNELALFAGAGGGILGGHLLGWRTVCAVEFDSYARNVLLARQRDGCLPRFPIWDDVRTFDGKPWRGHVDIVSGGFPCQDISSAGKGAGIDGERSGLWREMARIVGEVRPRFVWVENSPMLVGRGLALVLGDLAKMGYDARWGIVGAHHAGAPHKRDRIWIMAYASGSGRDSRDKHHRASPTREAFGPVAEFCEIERVSSLGNSNQQGCQGTYDHAQFPTRIQSNAAKSGDIQEKLAYANSIGGCGRDSKWQDAANVGKSPGDTGERWWSIEPQLGRVADGMAAGVDVHGTTSSLDVGRVATGISKRAARLKCIGNGQVPAALVIAWEMLYRK